MIMGGRVIPIIKGRKKILNDPNKQGDYTILSGRFTIDWADVHRRSCFNLVPVHYHSKLFKTLLSILAIKKRYDNLCPRSK